MNKHLFLTCVLALCTAIAAIAIPPSPRLLQELEEAGDTAAIRQLLEHSARLDARRREGAAKVAARADANDDMVLNAAPRGLVIIVSFSDLAFTTPKADIDSMLNGYNYSRSYQTKVNGVRNTISAKGSVAQYFRDNSMGKYNPQFDVVGPYTVSKSKNYYGQNDSDGNDLHVDELVKEAVKLADADGVDFTLYDNLNQYGNKGKDGLVDFILIYYAGKGEADGGASTTIWPHSFWMYSGYQQQVKVDNKYIDAYGCFNEINAGSGLLDGIGTCVHEFSHVIGLPDLYTTNYASHKTLGAWDVLDYGPYNNDGNTPPSYSAYERFVMGWLTPTVLSSAASINLEELQSSNTAYMVTSTGASNLKGVNPSPAEFFLIENRQKVGWDKFLPGHGMLITKVKYNSTSWWDNTVNNSSSSQGVDIIEADGKQTANSTGKQGDAFPTSTVTTYSPYTKFPITNIVENAGVISFDFMGGNKTSLDDMITDECDLTQVVAIYDISGRLIQQGGITLNDLQPGIYIGRTCTNKSIKFSIR